jgi:hypothetical protein
VVFYRTNERRLMGNWFIKHVLIYLYLIFFQYNNEKTLDIDCSLAQYICLTSNVAQFEQGEYQLIFIYYK